MALVTVARTCALADTCLPVHRGMRLEIEIPQEQILLSDFDLWHYPLNYWYFPDSEEDDQRFEQRCAAKAIDFYQMKPLPDQALHEQLVASWEKIFDLD